MEIICFIQSFPCLISQYEASSDNQKAGYVSAPEAVILQTWISASVHRIFSHYVSSDCQMAIYCPLTRFSVVASYQGELPTLFCDGMV